MKMLRWSWVALLCLGARHQLSAQGSTPPHGSARTEDQIFNATRQPPIALLRQLYEENQVLVLAFSDHDNDRQYRALDALLAQIDQDPRLKAIVLERFAENAQVLEAASVTVLDERQLQEAVRRPLPSDTLREGLVRWSLCDFPEWAYTWAEMLPRMRTFNARRPAGQKVRVTAVDQVMAAWRGGFWIDSYERDTMTAVAFHDRIWQPLRRDPPAKVIVVYNIGHVVQGFTLLRGDSAVPPTFLSMFLQRHPEARLRTAVVLVEGVNQGGTGQVFRFTQRQVARTLGQPFGVRTAPFRAVAIERGDSALTKKAWAIRTGLRTSARKGLGQIGPSTATLAEMVDAIVWLPPAEQLNFKPAKDYLPATCN